MDVDCNCSDLGVPGSLRHIEAFQANLITDHDPDFDAILGLNHCSAVCLHDHSGSGGDR
ncbi:hypothetical protein D3C79_1118470 [compost metagenome]